MSRISSMIYYQEKCSTRIILGEDPEESGIFAVDDGTKCNSKLFPFMGSPTNFYYIKLETEPLWFWEFGKTSWYELWHRRLGHSTNRNIRVTVAHSTGLEDLRSRTFDEHAKCPSCMIGKSTLEELPKSKDRAKEPLHQVNMDIFSSSVQSIDSYNYALILLDLTRL